MLYTLGFFGFFLSITFAKSHSKRLTYTNIKHQNIHNTKQTYNFTKDWVCVCVCQITLQTTAIYVYEHLIYFCYLQFFFQL